MMTNLSRSLLLLLMLYFFTVSNGQSTSLCISCASTFNGYCVSCNAGGCAAYAELDATSRSYAR
jgi:hypothetical protein